MVSRKPRVRVFAEREVGKINSLVILVSRVRGSPYLLRRLKCWGGLGYRKEVPMLEIQKE